MSDNNEIEMRKALEKAAIEWDKESPDDQFASEVFDDGFKRAWEHQQSRIAQLESQLEQSKLSRLDKENLEIGRQLQRAANDLPDLFNIEIDVENGCAGVTLINEDGNRRSFILDEHLSDTISEAIDAAIASIQERK
jgi:hypothetical protein